MRSSLLNGLEQMRQLAMLICYAGLAFSCYWISSTLVQPESSGSIIFESIKGPVAQSCSDREKQLIVARVNSVWDRIESELKKVAPDTLKGLNGPASESEIGEFENRMGMILPPALEASLRRHNGSKSPFGVFWMKSAKQIVSEHAKRSHGAVDSWRAVYYEDQFSHEAGWWEPGALVVGSNHFGMLVDTEQNDIT